MHMIQLAAFEVCDFGTRERPRGVLRALAL